MHAHSEYRNILFLLLICFLPATPVFAAKGEPPVLPTVTVNATRLDPLIGASRLTRERMANQPARNGSINELLSILPGVQFRDNKDSSFNGGEIKPPNLSISGGRANNNNFRIDGIGNNSLLDPLFDIPNSPSNIPGHPQETFLGTDLLEKLTIYEHNIPARFGGFSGGVIDAQTRDPAPAFEGRVKYRTTRDTWTKFHVSSTDKGDFQAGKDVTKQSHFDKQQISTEVSLPLSTRNRVLLSYQQTFSRLPLALLNNGVNQYRREQVFFFKYLGQLSDAEELRLTLTHSPYTEKRFLRKTRDSFFHISNAATTLSASYKHEGLFGDTRIKTALHISDDRREAPQNLLKWDAGSAGTPTSKDWGLLIDSDFSKEGGLGDLERNQQSMEFSVDWKSLPIDRGDTQHSVNIGLLYKFIDADMMRPEDAASYTRPELEATLSCPADDIACVTNEQYLSKRKIYLAGSTEVRVQAYDLYVEDDIHYLRFTIRPGLRFSYDDLMQNKNLAPRLAASYDLFGDGSTLLTSGWNRYYDRSIPTYKLRENITPHVLETRSYAAGTLTDWAPKPYLSPFGNRFTQLETPYSDEANVGLNQQFFGGRLILEYIERRYRDQLAKEVDPFDIDAKPYVVREATLNNNGQKDYKSARMAWERQGQKHFVSFNLTWEEVETSNDSYDDIFDDADLEEQVWYNGKLLYTYELPRNDYTRPWTANLIWEAQLPYHLKFTNTTKYRSSYRGLDDSKTNAPDGNDIYIEVRRPPTLTFDWRLAWKTDNLGLAIDIYNVFNRKNQVGSEEEEYGLGRQFWAELTMNF